MRTFWLSALSAPCGLFLSASAAQAARNLVPVVVPNVTHVLLGDAAHLVFFLLILLVILCLPRRN